MFSGGLDNRILAFSLENFKFRILIRDKFDEDEEYSHRYNIYVETVKSLTLKKGKRSTKSKNADVNNEKDKYQVEMEERDFLKNPPKQEIPLKVSKNKIAKEAKPFKSEEPPEKKQIESEVKEEEMQEENEVPQQKITRKQKQMKKK